MKAITLEQMQILCMHRILDDEKELFKKLQGYDFFNIDQFKVKDVRLFVNEFIKIAEDATERFERREFKGEIVEGIDDNKMYEYTNILFPREPKSWGESIRTSLSEDVCSRLLIEMQMFCIYPYYWLILNHYGKNAVMYFIHGLRQTYLELGWSEHNIGIFHTLLTDRIQEYHGAISKAEDGIGLMKFGKVASRNIIGEELNISAKSIFVLHVTSILTCYKPIFEKYKIC